MESFELKGTNGSLKLEIMEVIGFPDSTFFGGGYDSYCSISIRISAYSVEAQFSITTGNIYDFYESLKMCQRNLKGTAKLQSYEDNLTLEVQYLERGLCKIKGKFIEKIYEETFLKFEIPSDQSYLQSTLMEIDKIVKKYGNNYGIQDK